MTFTEKIVVAKLSAKVMNSFKVMQFIYKMKSSVVAFFSVNLMYSVNFMSVKAMLHCISLVIWIDDYIWTSHLCNIRIGGFFFIFSFFQD